MLDDGDGEEEADDGGEGEGEEEEQAVGGQVQTRDVGGEQGGEGGVRGEGRGRVGQLRRGGDVGRVVGGGRVRQKPIVMAIPLPRTWRRQRERRAERQARGRCYSTSGTPAPLVLSQPMRALTTTRGRQQNGAPPRAAPWHRHNRAVESSRALTAAVSLFRWAFSGPFRWFDFEGPSVSFLCWAAAEC